MDLLEIRQQFCRLSGRYDLATKTVVDFDTDNGADFYINAGQRFLDRAGFAPKAIGRRFEEVAAGAWYFTLQYCRAITEVWVNNSEKRTRLEKIDFTRLKEYYSDLISETDQGAPLYYAPALLRSTLSTDVNNLGSFLFNYTSDDDDGTFNGIVFAPPPDEAYVIEIVGNFYSDELSANTDKSYWSAQNPETLIKAGLYQLEVFYRNTAGANDWLAAIRLDIDSLEKDAVEEEVAELEELEG